MSEKTAEQGKVTNRKGPTKIQNCGVSSVFLSGRHIGHASGNKRQPSLTHYDGISAAFGDA